LHDNSLSLLRGRPTHFLPAALCVAERVSRSSSEL
jgi:hypothetical protein